MSNGETLDIHPAFPVTGQAVDQTIEFFRTPSVGNTLTPHQEAGGAMNIENADFFTQLQNFVDAWEMRGRQETDFVGGVTMTYKLLDTQAKLKMAKLPTVSREVINTFVEELNMTGDNSFLPHMQGYMERLTEEDPKFIDFVNLFTSAKRQAQGVDEAFNFYTGCWVAYEMLNRQASTDALEQQFGE